MHCVGCSFYQQASFDSFDLYTHADFSNDRPLAGSITEKCQP